MDILNNLIQIAQKTAIDAGVKIMEVYNAAEYDIALKADNSPITEADRQANEIITEALIKTKIPIISEETNIVDYEVRKHWKQCWVVDPLDGTKEFIKRNGEFTVNIALVENGAPIAGVIYVPVTKELYCGMVSEKRAYKTVVGTSEKNEALTGPDKTSTVIKMVGSRSHKSLATENFISSLKSTNQQIEVVAVGSSLKFCLLAEGKATIYPRFSPTMEWDTAAGDAICKAVGLSVLNAETKQPLKYNKKELVNPSFIVS